MITQHKESTLTNLIEARIRLNKAMLYALDMYSEIDIISRDKRQLMMLTLSSLNNAINLVEDVELDIKGWINDSI